MLNLCWAKNAKEMLKGTSSLSCLNTHSYHCTTFVLCLCLLSCPAFLVIWLDYSSPLSQHLSLIFVMIAKRIANIQHITQELYLNKIRKINPGNECVCPIICNTLCEKYLLLTYFLINSRKFKKQWKGLGIDSIRLEKLYLSQDGQFRSQFPVSHNILLNKYNK